MPASIFFSWGSVHCWAIKLNWATSLCSPFNCSLRKASSFVVSSGIRPLPFIDFPSSIPWLLSHYAPKKPGPLRRRPPDHNASHPSPRASLFEKKEPTQRAAPFPEGPLHTIDPGTGRPWPFHRPASFPKDFFPKEHGKDQRGGIFPEEKAAD